MPVSKIAENGAHFYRLNIFGKIRGCLIGVGILVCGGFLFSIIPLQFPDAWYDLLPIGMILVGVHFAAFAFCYRVELDEESVTVKGVFFTSSLKRNAIKGRRRITVFNLHSLDHTRLEPMDPKQARLKIMDDVGFDKEWEDWFRSLPNLDYPRKPKIYFKPKAKSRQKKLQK